MAKILKREMDDSVAALNPGRSTSISTPIADTRPYLTRHFPNSSRRRLVRLAHYYGVSLEEMLNCSVGHGLSALEKLMTEEMEVKLVEEISAKVEAAETAAEKAAESEADDNGHIRDDQSD